MSELITEKDHDRLGAAGEDQFPPVPDFNDSGPFSSASIVDMFQQEMQELADAKTVNIPVAGYGKTGLQIQYHMPERGRELGEIGRRVSREVKDTYSRNLFTAIDTMIHLCDGIYVNPEQAYPDAVPLDPDNTGEALTFSNPRLAELMDMSGTEFTARNMLRRLFAGNDLAILTHAEMLQKWLVNAKADIATEAYEGE